MCNMYERKGSEYVGTYISVCLLKRNSKHLKHINSIDKHFHLYFPQVCTHFDNGLEENKKL